MNSSSRLSVYFEDCALPNSNSFFRTTRSGREKSLRTENSVSLSLMPEVSTDSLSLNLTDRTMMGRILSSSKQPSLWAPSMLTESSAAPSLSLQNETTVSSDSFHDSDLLSGKPEKNRRLFRRCLLSASSVHAFSAAISADCTLKALSAPPVPLHEVACLCSKELTLSVSFSNCLSVVRCLLQISAMSKRIFLTRLKSGHYF